MSHFSLITVAEGWLLARHPAEALPRGVFVCSLELTLKPPNRSVPH